MGRVHGKARGMCIGPGVQVKKYEKDLDTWKKSHPKEYNQLVHVHQMHNKSPYTLKGSEMIKDVWAFITSLKVP